MGDPFSAQSLMKWGRRGALIAPAAYKVLEHGLTPTAGKEIVRIYSGVDGQPVRGWTDVIRVATNLAEGYLPYGITKVVTTGITKGSAMVSRFLGGR